MHNYAICTIYQIPDDQIPTVKLWTFYSSNSIISSNLSIEYANVELQCAMDMDTPMWRHDANINTHRHFVEFMNIYFKCSNRLHLLFNYIFCELMDRAPSFDCRRQVIAEEWARRAIVHPYRASVRRPVYLCVHARHVYMYIGVTRQEWFLHLYVYLSLAGAYLECADRPYRHFCASLRAFESNIIIRYTWHWINQVISDFASYCRAVLGPFVNA